MTHLDIVIDKCLDFFDYVDGHPEFNEQNFLTQNEMMVAYMLDTSDAREELLTYLQDSRVLLKAESIMAIIATVLEFKVDLGDPPWNKIRADIRAAASLCFGTAINDHISDRYNDYCDSNGIFSMASIEGGPAELLSFRKDDDGEEQRQQETDNAAHTDD